MALNPSNLVCRALLRLVAFAAPLLFAAQALATFHLFVVDQVFSNADGSIQYIVFLQSPPADDEHLWKTHELTSTHDGAAHTFVYPGNLPNRLTRNKRVLVATQGFADLKLVTPDFIIPNGFLGTGKGLISCCDDSVNYLYPQLPLDGATALDGNKAAVPAVATNFAGASAAVSVASAPALDLNQHGFTGSWYEPATDGQGLVVEIFPDLASPGTGYTQVSWFSYDMTAGGADRQRWYTLSGNVPGGQSSAALTIYRNTGGNFAAAPTTSAQAVGTATLSFDSCTAGQLTYAFNDGSGRSGTIPLTRLTHNVTCSATGARPTDADFALSGNWYDPVNSGQGVTVEVNPLSAVFFSAWYTYAPNGAAAGAAGQRWYTAQAAGYTRGTRSIPVQIYETTGGVFDAPSVPMPKTAVVGSGTFTFQGCTAATLAYAFTGGSSSGKSGAITMQRVGPVPKGCVQ